MLVAPTRRPFRLLKVVLALLVAVAGSGHGQGKKPAKERPAAAQPDQQIHEFDIEVTVEKIEILPLEEHHFYTFNKTLPGPVIRVKEGDWVKVNLTNKTHDFHTIHCDAGSELLIEARAEQRPGGHEQSRFRTAAPGDPASFMSGDLAAFVHVDFLTEVEDVG